MYTRKFLKGLLFILAILALSKSTSAQQIYFEISTSGISIVAGEPYPVVIPQPRVVYYEPLPRGYYYFDRDNHCYYNDYGDVYYYPSNVSYYYKHDNGKHKGWYKKRHRHEREEYEHEREYEHDDD